MTEDLNYLNEDVSTDEISGEELVDTNFMETMRDFEWEYEDRLGISHKEIPVMKMDFDLDDIVY